jgi:hypothetical protein
MAPAAADCSLPSIAGLYDSEHSVVGNVCQNDGIVRRAAFFEEKIMKSDAMLAIFSVAVLALPPAWAGDTLVIDVYKNAACGCCGGWEKHLQEAGFTVRSHPVDEVSATRRKLGMPQAYASCHTAKIGRYLIEGHVPGADVRRLFAEQPDAIGLAVPAMPLGSPGMESDSPQDYDVMLVGRDGTAKVFQHHPAR